MKRTERTARWVYGVVSPICDPLKVIAGLLGYPRYLREWRRYTRLPGAEPLRFLDASPQLGDRLTTTRIDPHYFYINGWAMRRVVTQRPSQHVDVGSQTVFVNLLSAVLPVTFIDFRPLDAAMFGLTNLSGDITNLPLESGSVESISCLSVAEHIGLGRYGDPLNPGGTRLACAELRRVLAPGGNLYFALPVGKPRVCFNAHRVHKAETIVEYFQGLDLVEFSGVDDDGCYVEKADAHDFSRSYFATGMFWLRKPASEV
jgi:hypothetical protein